MYDVKSDIVKALASTPKVLAALLPVALEAREEGGTTPRPGWSAVQIICHLRDAEERALERMQKMRDEEVPFLEAFDQDAWARERGYAAADPHVAMDRFLLFRRAHVDALDGLPFPEWERAGEHQEMGRITIMTHTLHIVSHDLNHLAQMAALRT